MANANFFSPDGGITRYPLEDTEGRITYEEEIHGINLFPNRTNSIDGHTYTVDSDGYVSTDWASDVRGWSYNYSNVYMSLKAGTYRVKAFQKTAKTSGYIGLAIFDTSNNSILNALAQNEWNSLFADDGVLFTLSQNMNIGIEYKIGNGSYAFAIYDADLGITDYHKFNQQSIQNQLNVITGMTGVRNWLPIEASTETNNGITYTVNKDNNGNVLSIHMSGTSIAASNLVLNNTYKLTVGDYVAVCKYTGTTNGQYPIVTNTLYNSDGTQKTNDYAAVTANNPKTAFSITENEYLSSFRIYIPNGRTVDCTVYFMIKLASDPDDTYVPYAMTNRELTERRIQKVTITGTTTSNGNIATDIDPSEYALICAYVSNITNLTVTPMIWGDTGKYGLHIRQAIDTNTVINNTAVTVVVMYAKI